MRVLLDDRDRVSPGVKFKDAELLGIPTIVVVGRGLADGNVEVRDRRTGERADVPVAEAVDHPRVLSFENGPIRADCQTTEPESAVAEQALVDDDAVADRRREHGLAVAGLPRPDRERLAGEHRRGEAALDVVEARRVGAAQRVQQGPPGEPVACRARGGSGGRSHPCAANDGSECSGLRSPESR